MVILCLVSSELITSIVHQVEASEFDDSERADICHSLGGNREQLLMLHMFILSTVCLLEKKATACRCLPREVFEAPEVCELLLLLQRKIATLGVACGGLTC